MITFIKNAFMDGDKPSWARLIATPFVLFPMLWVSYLVYVNHALPSLAELTILVTGGIGATYGVNKFSTPAIVKAEDQGK